MTDSRAPLDLCGLRFGKLLVMAEAGRDKYMNRLWRCQCVCGHETVVPRGSLVGGNTRSCGCLQPETVKAIFTQHGGTSGGHSSPEHTAWWNMIQRCRNPAHPKYKDYGARGITVCAEWKESFQNFLRDLGRRPSDDHTLERVNNAQGYHRRNCKWATHREQQQNRRVNLTVQTPDGAVCAAELARRIGVSKGTMYYRIRAGWTFKRMTSH